MTTLIAMLILKATPSVPAHPIACSNPVKCQVTRGVVVDRRDRVRR